MYRINRTLGALVLWFSGGARHVGKEGARRFSYFLVFWLRCRNGFGGPFQQQRVVGGGAVAAGILLIFQPGFINFAVDDVDLSTSLTRNIRLRKPFVSSPMDTVTEDFMAVAMAAVGGIGFVHYNNPAREQADIVRRAKRQRVGYVGSPVCVRPSDAISAIDTLKTVLVRGGDGGRRRGAGRT